MYRLLENVCKSTNGDFAKYELMEQGLNQCGWIHQAIHHIDIMMYYILKIEHYGGLYKYHCVSTEANRADS